MPDMAAPMANCSQFARALSVDPSAPVKIGTRIGTFALHPYSVRVSTAGNTAASGPASIPSGSPFAPTA
ncbi:MAG: hypothetical protein BWX50_00697 [Euryarchaeota archaeon ADurb.Bin009]|nr:MAG: hypothetical protein BWX50_00697 [Euryarchaeota archaeon ADurb.Bin009]